MLETRTMTSLVPIALAIFVAGSPVGIAVHAAESGLVGRLLDHRSLPASGVPVTACRTDRDICTTVFTDSAGKFDVPGLQSGRYRMIAGNDVSGRSEETLISFPSSRPRSLEMRLGSPSPQVSKTDPDYLAELPAGEGRALLRSVCVQCHGITEKFFLASKSREQWERTVDNMLAKIAPLPEGQREVLVSYLSENFDAEAFARITHETAPAPRRSSIATNVTFVEYRMPPRRGEYDPTTGTNLTTHDVRMDRRGNLWISEMARDSLVKLDPRTGEFTEYPIPYKSSGPHGVVIDAADDVWVTLIWADRLMKFSQERNAFTIDAKIPAPASWPHTVVIDSRGNLWFTEMHGNAIGKYDPAKGAFSRYPVPTPKATPYGIAVDAEDNVWFTGITYHKIGRIDAKTRQITEYVTPTPLSATRKLAVDRDGNVWCTEFGAGKLARLDPRTGVITEYRLPSEYSSPYDVTVGSDGRIWFPDFNGNSVIAFDANVGTFAEFPIPSPLSRPRIIDPDPAGGVWISESEAGKVARVVVR